MTIKEQNQDLEANNQAAGQANEEQGQANSDENDGLGLGGDSAGKQEEKTPEQIAEEEAQKELFGKPETYDYKDLMPEGMQLNEEMTGKFNSVAEKLNLSQKGAGELIALAVELQQQNQTKMADAYAQANEAKKAEYQEALKNDKEIGGAKLTETLKVANLAYEHFADEKVQELLFETGLNSHPDVVKMMFKIGKLMESDKIHESKTPPSTEKSAADILYGNTGNKN